MLDWLACQLLAPRLVDLTEVSGPPLPEPWVENDLLARTQRTFQELDALRWQPHGPTNPYRLLMGMGCRDLTTREADQQPDTAGRSPNYAPYPAFQPLEIPLENGPQLTGHHSTGAPGAPVVIVVHGLFDSHVTGYVVEYAESLRRQGFHVVALDLRDHGRQLGRGLPPSLGIEEGRDLFAAARTLSHAEGVSVGMVGMSYGAHCVVRAAHEATLAGEADVLRGGVLAISGPLDIHEAILSFDDHARLPQAESLMDRMIFSELTKVLDRHLRLRCRAASLSRTGSYRSYVEQVVLPAYPEHPAEFETYLKRASSAQPAVMAELKVPTAIVHPVDDPLVPVLHARRAREAAGSNPYVHVRELASGGHIGLAGVDGPGTLQCLATWFGRLRDG